MKIKCSYGREHKVKTKKIEKIILETNNRDYCRACKPCSKPPCQRIKSLAHALTTTFERGELTNG